MQQDTDLVATLKSLPMPQAEDPNDASFVFAPIPVASGTSITHDGTRRTVQEVVVVVTDDAGNEHRTTLNNRNSGWWV